ncbi:MAG: type II toxin-antitoxin system PemK/MazF family toxin [Oscillospiraceae bacterium]|nr:type II toxin-antitoxin system PemK/MazF family toxin [Oscillospiraceae bacterium]
MGKFVKGDVVVINFPFSDLSGAKRRPALVIADLSGDDIILCQITSNLKKDKYSIPIEEGDFADKQLAVESIVRPNKIFTADKNIIQYTICRIDNTKTNKIIESIIEMLKPQQ